jgi:hypothetical protein
VNESESTRDIRQILRRMRIVSPSSFYVGAQQFAPQNAADLVSQLRDQIYQHSFCRRPQGHGVDAPADPDQTNSLSAELSTANATASRWETGWQIYHVTASGQISAQNHGISRSFWPGEFINYGGTGMPPEVGATVSVFFPKEATHWQPGFYFAFSETVSDQEDDSLLVRFYWNINDVGAVRLVELVTKHLNRFQVPFRLKCLSERNLFPRTDAAVLFVTKRFFQITARVVSDVHRQLLEFLRRETPLFTKKLAPGLGLAEDPANGESFGLNRCGLLAQALYNAYSGDLGEEDAVVREVAKHFGEHGILLERPYLNAGSVDQYNFAFEGA